MEGIEVCCLRTTLGGFGGHQLLVFRIEHPEALLQYVPAGDTVLWDWVYDIDDGIWISLSGAGYRLEDSYRVCLFGDMPIVGGNALPYEVSRALHAYGAPEGLVCMSDNAGWGFIIYP